jgi:hypothetical protein
MLNLVVRRETARLLKVNPRHWNSVRLPTSEQWVLRKYFCIREYQFVILKLKFIIYQATKAQRGREEV